MYIFFLARRYLHTKLIAIFAILGVTLCVAMILVVLSVMGGFLDTIKQKSRGILSDIIMEAGTLQGWPYYEEFEEYVHEKLPDVVDTSTPVIHNFGIFRLPRFSYTKPTSVMGIKFDEYIKMNDFNKGLHYEKYFPGTTHLGKQGMPVIAFNKNGLSALPVQYQEANEFWRENEKDKNEIKEFDENPFDPYPTSDARRMFEQGERAGFVGPEKYGLIAGTDLINNRTILGTYTRICPKGCDVALTLMPLTRKGNISSEGAIKLPLRYVDDSRTHVYDIDSMNVYVDFDMLQKQLAMDKQETIDGEFTPPRTTQLMINIKEGVSLNEAREQIKLVWSDFKKEIAGDCSPADWELVNFVEVSTWEDLQQTYIASIEKEKVLVTFLFVLISFVAVVLIGCIFYMIVQKKTRDIGIIKALGASSGSVYKLFISYAAIVGLIGSILGIAIGAVFVWYINDIQDLLIQLHPGLRVWDPTVYAFDRIPNVVKLVDVIVITIAAIVSSMIGAIIPARIAAKIWPVQALRYE